MTGGTPHPPRRNDDRNDTAPCPACGKPVTRTGRRRWCSPACRQAGWRQRNPPPPAEPAPSPATRPAREHTIYQCGDCDQRYLGQQWCPDCNRPCRRVGPGGTCPHCDEPVALQDLITTT